MLPLAPETRQRIGVSMMNEELSGPVVHAIFTLTIGEYQVANQHLRAKRSGRFLWLWKAVAVVLMIGLVSKLFTDHSVSWDGWFCSGVIVFAVLLSLLSSWQQASSDRKFWNKNDDWREPQSYGSSPETVKITTPTTSVTMDWKYIVAAETAGPFIFLTHATGGTYLLPERAFQSDDDRRTFQQFVEAKVPKCKL
jgi:hypothetical protein